MEMINFLFRDPRDPWQSKVLYAWMIAYLSWIALGGLAQIGGV